MGKMGGSRHLKREMAPSFWPIHRKEFHWITKPKPGPHPIYQCIPLILVVREIFGFAKTRREAKRIISQGNVLVDGKIRRDELFPTGLMDVISIPKIKKNYRVLPSRRELILHLIGAEEAEFKLCRIDGKRIVKDGRIQLNLHDGKNILTPVKDPNNPDEDVYRTFDTLKVRLKDGEVIEHLKLAKDMSAVFIGGKNMGKYGNIVSLEKQSGRRRKKSIIVIKDEKGETYQTILDYIFVVGDKNPCISLPRMEV